MDDKTNIAYDKKLLDEIRARISKSIQAGKTTNDSWAVTSLQYCLLLIDDLVDENESVWFMLEEIKKSKWSKENSIELEKSINQQLTMLKMLQSSRRNMKNEKN